ncbi:hypothetical protein [Jannaschia marina]|uniref:hypothetical protein n=1 Tax=Jannaschia marina TaxID=2741674 RepID=UPI0015CB46B6|nr:hypothetical protein [Jannaschia marina]
MIWRRTIGEPRADIAPSAVPGALHATLLSRDMPETVAQIIAAAPEIAADRRISAMLARRSRRPRRSSMPEGWFEPVDMARQVRTAQALWAEDIAMSNDPRARIYPHAAPAEITAFLTFLSERLGVAPGAASFKYDRPDRAARAATSGLGNHAFNKRFRLLARMRAKLIRYRKELRFLSYRVTGKAGLLADVTPADMERDIWSAAFVAYYAARKRRRSAFTNTAQDRPFDDLCAALLERATNWPLLARVLPEPRVLAHLDEGEKGRLIGAWTMILRDVADDLWEIWQRSDIDLDTMIVKRGNDSSSWNIAAQAWNSARTGWIATQQAMGMDALLDHILPGKVLRLMAADVAYWHRATGGALHPDTAVWAELPYPWDVMRGTAFCGRASVDAACRRAGLDPVKSGWSAPLVSTTAVPYAPTPELVHGVTVASPEMAAVLRKAGWFSGKT